MTPAELERVVATALEDGTCGPGHDVAATCPYCRRQARAAILVVVEACVATALEAEMQPTHEESRLVGTRIRDRLRALLPKERP